MSSLDRYHAKRDFTRTAEPKGKATRRKAALSGGIFVIHKHAARRLHYDLRLEHGGVLWSWAVTRGPSLDPSEKRLAVHVEDHPIDYGAFEGTIPKGEYGAGSVIVWDEGQWTPEGDPEFGMNKGHLAFTLAGQKLGGRWHLVRLKPRGGESRENWLLMKVEDEFANGETDILVDAPNSVKSGVGIEAIGAEAKTAENVWPKTKRPKNVEARSKRKSTKSAVSALPDFVAPCLATLVEKPPSGDDWLHEVKFDGYRVQARIVDGTASLLTRTGLDWTGRFGSTLSKALSELPCANAVLDGEIVALADNGIASFSALQLALSENTTGELVFFAFDLLGLDGVDLRSEPFVARKEHLQDLLSKSEHDGRLRYSEHFVESGQTILSHACRMGLEGVVSKRAAAAYRSGRSKDWLKSKCTLRQEFVIVGYVPSKGSGRELGSLVVGYFDDENLVPAGRVGSGFSRKSAAALKVSLDGLKTKTSAFQDKADREPGVVWVKPTLVAEVEFRSWTASRMLRHATFQGLRDDKPADDVVAEVPMANEPKTTGKKTQRAPAALATTSVTLSNPAKILWPDSGLTKKGLLDYYAKVWPRMEAYVVNRPLSLLRAPNGIEGHKFFQKHAAPGMHGAISTVKSGKDGEDLLVIGDFDGLAALVQLGTLEIHIWGSMVDAIETPDQVVFDLDPDEGVSVERVRDAARDVGDRLRDIGFDSFLKTSGGKGFHVVVALKPKADWSKVKTFAHDFAKAMEQAEPKLYTATLSKRARKNRIFIDYLRNTRGATTIAPYSTRGRPGAAVSMPVAWSELEGLKPDQFDTANAAHHLKASGDPWSDFFHPVRELMSK